MNSNKVMSVEQIVNSDEYYLKRKKALDSLLAKTRAATTEASVATAFETELFYFIKLNFGKDITFDKEVGQTDLKHKRHIFTGRMDAVSNDLVIEYKKANKNYVFLFAKIYTKVLAIYNNVHLKDNHQYITHFI